MEKEKRINLVKSVKSEVLDQKIELKVKEFKELISMVENLEIELDKSKKEILRLNNIDIEEDVKKLIADKDIPNLTDYKSDLEGECWYKLYIDLDYNVKEEEKLKKCTIIRFKNEASLYEFIKRELRWVNIKEVNENIEEKKVFNNPNSEVITYKSKEKNKYMLIYKVYYGY